MRIKLTIEYVGTNYSGWQSQVGGNTVQDKVENALSDFFGGAKIRLHPAGRTDVGVHAVCQVAHFDVDKEVKPFKLCLGVNLSLPQDIAVTNAEIVADDFDARYDAQSKTYCYRIYVSPIRKPHLDVNCCQIYKPLDLSAMQRAGDLLTGTHDFKAFQNTGSNLKGTVRTVNYVKVVQNGEVIEIFVNGNAFLYNMVRIMASALVSVGSGKMTEEHLAEILQNGNRKMLGKTLPAKGLTLEKVYY